VVGAIEGEHWRKIAKGDKGRLLMELDGDNELQAIHTYASKKNWEAKV
jgi:hypothetical protein